MRRSYCCVDRWTCVISFLQATVVVFFFFFFQAEDGIRDGRVTGVQTCALPIFALADEAKVAEWLAALAEPAVTGRLVCCLSARGGAGASTLSASLALAAAGHGDALLLDGDVQGGGIDYLLGLESVDGARWPQLRDACGLLSAAALAESLPQAGRMRVLAARGGAMSPVPQPALTAVVEAGLRGHDVVVADVDRGGLTAPVWTSYAEV